MKRALVTVVAILASLALAQTAPAKNALELALTQFRVVSEARDGKTIERFEKADTVKPNDIVEYREQATNRSDKPLKNVVIDLPIPKSTSYLDGTASDLPGVALLQASWDDKKTFAVPPLKRKVVRDGKTIEEAVRANEYTNLRWVLKGELAPGRSIALKARVQVR